MADQQLELRESKLLFPEDIERLIFETAATYDTQTALRLILVARRVQLWIEPFLYESIHVRRCRAFLRSLIDCPKPLTFYARHMKCLDLPHDIRPSDLILVRSTCTGVVELGCRIAGAGEGTYLDPLAAYCSSLRLWKLEAILGPTVLHLRHPVFQNVTHLIIQAFFLDWIRLTGFDLLHRLTHLRMDIRHALPEKSESIWRSVMRILSSCDNLQIIVFFDQSKPHEKSTFANPRIILGTIEDLRLVVIKGFDERAVYEGRVNPWHVAEAAAKRQRQSSNRRTMIHNFPKYQ